jgi:toxin ParE1/3/4
MRLVFAASARRDLAEAIDFIRQDNPAAAQEQSRRIRAAARRLPEFPHLGGELDDDRRRLQVPRTPFILVYRVTPGAILILRVWHGARQWPPAED